MNEKGCLSRCPFITESEGTQSVVQSDEIYSDCFDINVLIPLSDCRAKFPIDSELQIMENFKYRIRPNYHPCPHNPPPLPPTIFSLIIAHLRIFF